MFEARFQSFDDASDRAATGARVAALRTELARRGLTGLIVPRADRHQNEYVPACEERLAWLTGFTGSAGAAIVLMDRAVLFVDGRYTLAGARAGRSRAVFDRASGRDAAQPVDRARISPPASASVTIPGCTPSRAPSGSPRPAPSAGATLVAVEPDLIDAIWHDRPPPPLGPVTLHDSAFRRRGRGEQACARARRDRQAQGRCARRLRSARGRLDSSTSAAPTSPTRRCRLPSPSCRARAAIALCRRPQALERRSPPPRRHSPMCASPPISSAISRRSATTSRPCGSIRRPPPMRWRASSPAMAARSPRGADPIALMKAVKNPVEIAGARAAQARDGAAVTRFLAWFDREAPNGQLTEIEAVKALESFRRDTGLLKDVSFPTISGAGPDGAIVHYRVTAKTDRTIAPGELFLIDSGGAVRGRHHRHHPHHRGRRAERGNARPLHARAQGPHRDRARGVSRRHERRAARLVCAAVSVGRPASTSITAPATASAAICRCTKARRASPSSARRRSSAA